MRSGRMHLSIAATLALVASALTMVAGPVVVADSLTEGFDGFSLGSPNGQFGWSALGSVGSGCATYDEAIVDNTYGIVSFGSKSLRVSNAVTSGCFSDQMFSASLANEAGESSAANDGYSGGTRQSHFEAQWDFASAVPGAEQPGLAVSASPDRGDGARMSWIQMADTPSGLAVNFYDYRDEHVVGGPDGDPNGALANDGFFETTVASGLDRTAVHTIKLSMDFLDGQRNDVVRVWVDGALVHVDTSWEDYFRYSEGNPTRTVDSILFRSGGTPAPAALGDGFLIDNFSLSSGPTTVADSTGAWTLFPAQPVTSETTTTDTTLYKASVQPPIRADGSSTFPANRGVIPVKFGLASATRTIVTTTTTTGPVLFRSIGSDTDTANDYAFLRFEPTTAMAFADLDGLVADYAFTTGNCAGGSLRWQVALDTNDDGTADGNLQIYFGDVPDFTDCAGAESQTGVNLIGSSDARFDLTQLGGAFYGTYADALASVGTAKVLKASLVLDGGWKLDQVVDLTSATVDGASWTPLPVGESTATDSDTTTPFASTCKLPQAALKWAKDDPTPDAAVNDAESIQPGDPGLLYRIVDCKYIYNLDIRSLGALADRAGTYWVWVVIDGTKIDDPAVFGLRPTHGQSADGHAQAPTLRTSRPAPVERASPSHRPGKTCTGRCAPVR